MPYANPYKAPRKRRSGPAGVVGNLKRRHKLTPQVGKLAGGGLAPLALNKRKANLGTDSPFRVPGASEPKSAPYRIAKRRTRKKARAF